MDPAAHRHQHPQGLCRVEGEMRRQGEPLGFFLMAKTTEIKDDFHALFCILGPASLLLAKPLPVEHPRTARRDPKVSNTHIYGKLGSNQCLGTAQPGVLWFKEDSKYNLLNFY